MPKQKNTNGDYPVGYGKPPEATRFRKGVSGNPKGRPKGSKNISSMLLDAGRQTVQITRNGRPQVVSLMEAGILQLYTKAAGGDPRAMREIFSAHRTFVQLEVGTEETQEIAERDKTVMKSILRRINSVKGPGTPDGGEEQ